MDSFGCFIKTEREKKGVSLAEVSAATKINPHLLEALESDHIEKLPAPAFVKGFVRSYARYLGLDSKEVVHRYLDFISSSELIMPDRFIEGRMLHDGKIGFDQNKILIRAKQIGNRRIFFIFIIFVFILGICFFWSLSSKRTSISVEEPNLNLNMKQNMEINESKSVSSIDDLIQDEPKTEIPIEVPLEPGSKTILGSVSEAFSYIPTDTYEKTKKDPKILPDHKELIITSHAETWIDIKIDDNPHYDFIMKPGDIIKLGSESVCHLWIGNAGGIEITYDGKSFSNLGKDGDVIRLRFPE